EINYFPAGLPKRQPNAGPYLTGTGKRVLVAHGEQPVAGGAAAPNGDDELLADGAAQVVGHRLRVTQAEAEAQDTGGSGNGPEARPEVVARVAAAGGEKQTPRDGRPGTAEDA